MTILTLTQEVKALACLFFATSGFQGSLLVEWGTPISMRLTGPIRQEVQIVSSNGTVQSKSQQWEGNKISYIVIANVDSSQNYLISLKLVSELGLGDVEVHFVQPEAQILT